jgi:hypothetical protein
LIADGGLSVSLLRAQQAFPYVVLFGDFGNLKKSTEPNAHFPVKLEIDEILNS